VPVTPPPESAGPVLLALSRLRERARTSEAAILDGLAVLGEPVAQRVLDDWLDLAGAATRAVGDEAATQAARLTSSPAGRPMAAAPSPPATRGTR